MFKNSLAIFINLLEAEILMLNSNQKKSVECITKPCIVIAGPGSGKTYAIVSKIDYLVKEKKINSDEILALTFTEKAADEMQSRLDYEINSKTFHSFALEIIEEYSHQIKDLKENFNLIDEASTNMFFIENIPELKFNTIEVKESDKIARIISHTILKLKDNNETLKSIPLNKDFDPDVKSDLMSAFLEYEKYKKDLNLIDFGDILLIFLELLKSDKKILDGIKKRYNYVLVDEFQDTNLVQLEILKLICENNITIVGDLKQSIYGFRGANIKNLSEFKKHFENFEEIFLTENYRSSKEVIAQLNNVVKNISDEKELLKSTTGLDGEFRVFECTNEKSQMTFILDKISEINELTDSKSDIAILCRTKFEAKKIIKFLEEFGIKIAKTDIENVFDSQSVKSLVTILKIISNPKEANKELFHILSNSGIRNETLKMISRSSSRKEKSLYNVISKQDISDYDEDSQIVNSYYTKIEKLNKLKNSNTNLKSLILKTIEEFNLYKNALVMENLDEVFSLNCFLKFLENMRKIHKNLELNKFLHFCDISKRIGLNFELDKKILGNVNVMTVHQSKGMEFDYVFVPSLNMGRFPVTFKKETFPTPYDFNREEFLEDENRLFFVALSRAKNSIYLSYVRKFSDNKLDSKFSPFLSQIEFELERYDKEISDLDYTSKEKIKVDVLKRINDMVFNNNFESAKSEIEVLKGLYGKRDLNSYFGGSNSKIKDLKDQMKPKSNSLEVDFDTSDMVYSVSQLQTYDTCPKKYMYQYIYKIPTKPRHYFDFGTTVHKVLELLLDDFGKIPDDKLYTKGVSLLSKHWISKGYENSEQEKEYYNKGLQILKEFIEKENLIRTFKRETISQEMKFMIEFEGRKFTGIIDRIDKTVNGYEIIDYKTSNSMQYKSKLECDMQLMVYAIALKNEFKVYPKKAGLWYLIHDKILMIEPKAENIHLIREKVIELIKNIEEKKFKAKPSQFGCKYCDFNDICSSAKFN